MDHIEIACLRLYLQYYLDLYRYVPQLRRLSSVIAEAAKTDDVDELEEEEWPEAVPDLEEEWPDALPDLEEEEWPHTLVDLEERESADSVADFEEESADDAVSVDFER